MMRSISRATGLPVLDALRAGHELIAMLGAACPANFRRTTKMRRQSAKSLCYGDDSSAVLQHLAMARQATTRNEFAHRGQTEQHEARAEQKEEDQLRAHLLPKDMDKLHGVGDSWDRRQDGQRHAARSCNDEELVGRTSLVTDERLNEPCRHDRCLTCAGVDRVLRQMAEILLEPKRHARRAVGARGAMRSVPRPWKVWHAAKALGMECNETTYKAYSKTKTLRAGPSSPHTRMSTETENHPTRTPGTRIRVELANSKGDGHERAHVDKKRVYAHVT